MTSNTDPPKATSWHSITKNTAKLSEMRVQPGYNGKTIDDESWNQLRESANTACLAIARHKGSDRCETYRSALVKHHLDVFSWQCYCMFPLSLHNLRPLTDNSQGPLSNAHSWSQ